MIKTLAAIGLTAACSAASAEPLVIEVRSTMIEGTDSAGDTNTLIGSRMRLLYELDTTDAPTFQSPVTNSFTAGFTARCIVTFLDRQDGSGDAEFDFVMPGNVFTARRSNTPSLTDRFAFSPPFAFDGTLLGLAGTTFLGPNVAVDLPYQTFPPDDIDDATIFAAFAGQLEPGAGSSFADPLRVSGTGVAGMEIYDAVARRVFITVGPVIYEQPESVSVSPGGTAELRASVVGAGASAFQWTKDGVPLIDDGRVSGATTDTLTISPAAGTDTGAYALELTGPHGTTVSEPATLGVPPAPDCPADVNGDGLATPADFTAWLAAFQAGCP